MDSIAGRLAWGAPVALFGLLLSSLFTIEAVPAVVLASLFLLAAAAAWKPAVALTAVAILVPIASWIGRTWHGGLAWPEAVALAFLAGYSAARAFGPRRHRADVLDLAIYAFIAIVAASVAVNLQVLAGTVGWQELRRQLLELATTDYLLASGEIGGIDAGMRLIEGLLLAHAGAFVVKERPEMRRSLIVTVVVGAVAASALNLWRIWLGALRLESPVAGFFRYLATLRFNTHYADVNAAGSYFGMTLLPALVLARGRAAWFWAPASLVIALSLMLSGSRAAVLGALAAGVGAWWLQRSGRGTGGNAPRYGLRWSAVAAVVLVAVAAYFAVFRNMTPVSGALRVRAEYVAVSLDMVSSYPVFGIGVGLFPLRLQEFASPGLMAIYPVARENPHNNFLQVLTELGIIGLAAFATVLWIAARRSLSRLRTGGDLLQLAASAGLLAFVLTWLSGHPLLVDAPAFSFWVLLGAVSAGPAQPSLATSPRSSSTAATGTRWNSPWRRRGLVVSLLIVLLVSVPIRARRQFHTANLEHLGIGVSQWQTGDDGTEYRLAGERSIVFVPSYAAVVEVPLRAVRRETTLVVEVYLDGRLADVVSLRSDAWQTLTLQMPQRDGRRFRALEFRIRSGLVEPGTDALIIGKVHPRGI